LRVRVMSWLWGRTVPLRDLTRNPNNLSWASMNDEQTPARTDTPGEPASGPTLARVRRRGESHRLTLMSAAAVVFVAIAIAKPWGESAPPPGPSAATPSLAAEIAKSSTGSTPPGPSAATLSETASSTPLSVVIYVQPQTASSVTIYVQPGEAPTTLTVACTGVPGVSPSVVGSAEPVLGLQYDALVLVCTGVDLQRVESVLPSPSAP
jgi:hypothetical protein